MTPYRDGQPYAAGYPNSAKQTHTEAGGLATIVIDKDIAVWYSLGAHVRARRTFLDAGGLGRSIRRVSAQSPCSAGLTCPPQLRSPGAPSEGRHLVGRRGTMIPSRHGAFISWRGKS